MVEVRFRIRNTVFNAGNSNRRTAIRPIIFQFPTLEEAALLASIDDGGNLVPREQVFCLSHPSGGPVIEGFVDSALGEFVRAQLEALSSDGLPPAESEVHGLEPFIESFEPDDTERLRDLISVCEFRDQRIHSRVRGPVPEGHGLLRSIHHYRRQARQGMAPLALHHDFRRQSG